MSSHAEESVRNSEGTQGNAERVRGNMITNTVAAPAQVHSDESALRVDNARQSTGIGEIPALQKQNLDAVDEELNAALAAHRQVGQLSAREPGVGNSALHAVKKVIRRSLAWYTVSLQLFQGAILRSLRGILAILEGHESNLAAMTTELNELREKHTSLSQDVSQLLITMDVRPRRSSMLKENAKIIAYWDNAAATDPMRETVTQAANESDEAYQENWKNVGEYVASKIMSYSPPNPVALEIGPGMGRITVPMSRYCSSITALDISAEMVRQARQTMADVGNLEIKLILDEDLQLLPSEHFDLAYSISCFQHAEKKTFYRYLEGIRRALKPGGVLFFGVLNLCSEIGWGHFSAIVKNDYPEFFHTPDEISAYLQRAGYSSHKLVEEGETLWAIAYR